MSDNRDDIERYLRGDMTPSEMHALEKKALQDPFLADALEGASGISPDEFSSDIGALREKLSGKNARTRGAVRWYYQAAAAVLLTGIAGLMILYLSSREKATTPIALNVPSQTESRQQPSSDSDTVMLQESPADEARKQTDTRSDAPEAARTERSVSPDVPVEREAEKKIEESIELDVAPEPGAAPQAAEDAPAETLALRLREGTAAKTEPAAGAQVASDNVAHSRIVRGRVTDAEDGMPLPGVNVTVAGTANGTITDLNGNYEIAAPPTAKKLVFSFVGLNAVEAAVPEGSDDSATLDVKMAPDVSALSEVVVVGYGNEDEYGFEEIRWEPAEPEGGKRAFRRYLETNLRYPRIALDNKIEGKVTVQFTIEPTGNLTDFRVIRSLGYGCDEEVIRLIREGPQWKPTKRNDEPVRGKGKVKLKFALPPDKK